METDDILEIPKKKGREQWQREIDDIIATIDLILDKNAEEYAETENNYRERSVLRLVRDRLKEIVGD